MLYKFRENLTLESIEEIKRELLQIINESSSKSLLLSFDNVEKVDLSFIQLLHSLKIYLQNKNIILKIKRIPEIILNILNSSGFLEDFASNDLEER